MAKQSHQKTKLLRLAQILLESSDEDHPIPVARLIESLERYGISAERKSIYDDLESLKLVGLDVQNRKGKSPGWFIGERDFELPELKLLMDAVQSSRFITQRKSRELLHKLEKLASCHQAEQLKGQICVSGRVKLMNESIYYHVDKLHRAIGERRAVTFRYFDYNVNREKEFRHGGKLYRVSPFGLVWNSENYYLVAFDHEFQELRHYRVDKMSDLTMTDQPRQGDREYPDFDLEEYEQTRFGMFTGREMKVTLRGRRDMAHVVWDRFGQDIIMVPDGEDHFTVTIDVALSPQFFGWVLGLSGGVTIAAPEPAVREYRACLTRALEE